MRPARRAWITGGVGLCLLIIAFARLASSGPGSPVAGLGSAALSSQPQNPFEAEWQEARRWHLQARTTVKRQLEVLEEWDPDAFNGSAIEKQRLHLLAQSRELQAAHEAAERAVALARGADETYQATRLLARIECESGRHQAELRHARRLVKLAPRDEHSLLALRHAEACIELGTSPDRQAQSRPQSPSSRE